MTTPFGGIGFGNPTTSAPTFGAATGSTFGTLGAPAVTTTNTGFSFSGFGTAATAAPSTGFSFGTNPTTASSGFFTNPSTTSVPSFTGFGVKTTPSFNFGAQTSTTPSFSFSQPSAFSGATAFGFQGTTTASALPGISGASIGDSSYTHLVAALTCPVIYGDERDAVIANWNQIQAFWGTGKAFYSTNAAPIELTADNPFCRFKAIGYSCMPSAKPEDGLVSLIFNKKEEDVKSLQQQVIDHLNKCFGSKPNIAVCIDTLKVFPEDKTEMVIFLLERSATGTTRRILPSEVCSYLEQPTIKPQLASIGIIHASPKTSLSKDQLQLYLDTPPIGIEPFIWQQAIVDNPDPEKLIPVPLIGFENLHRRMKCQEYETKQHQERLDIIADDIAELNRKRAITAAKIAESKRKLTDLQHRVLKMLVQQEITRKMGFSILEDEEELRIKLEAIQAELNAPTQFKGHLKELISQIRMQNFQTLSGGQGERYTMDEISKEKMKDHLRLQQEGISHLIAIIKDDLLDLKTIEDVSKEVLTKRG